MSNGTEDGGPIDTASDVLAEDGGNIASPQVAMLAATTELWTTMDMEEAEPCDIIEISEEQIREMLDMEEARPQPTEMGEGTSSGGVPEVSTEEAEATGADVETLAGYAYPPPFTRWENMCKYTTYPFCTIGKLFFRRGGSRYVCSAASIGNCAIWTAGHCLHAGDGKPDGWSTNVVFVPAYKDGNAPFGQWSAKQLWVRTSWYKNGIPKGLCQDMGGAILHKRNGRKISQVVGWLGFAWNWSRVQHWLSIGYPAAAPFNGQRMNIAAASYAYNGSVGCTPAPVGMGNDLTGGSSGGPWVWKFGTGNYANGNNSYRRSTKPKEMYSPYFGNAAKSLFDTLKKASC